MCDPSREQIYVSISGRSAEPVEEEPLDDDDIDILIDIFIHWLRLRRLGRIH
jgi:cobalamin biosynthesis Mg chelatase CobN